MNILKVHILLFIFRRCLIAGLLASYLADVAGVGENAGEFVELLKRLVEKDDMKLFLVCRVYEGLVEEDGMKLFLVCWVYEGLVEEDDMKLFLVCWVGVGGRCRC